MNAKELHDHWLNRLDRPIDGTLAEKETILRALRLLAAAEANDGSTPEVDEFGMQPVTDLLISHVMRTQAHAELESLLRDWGQFARRLERERNGLAARVAELERAVDLAARAMAGEGVEDQGQAWDRCLRILDAARSQP